MSSPTYSPSAWIENGQIHARLRRDDGLRVARSFGGDARYDAQRGLFVIRADQANLHRLGGLFRPGELEADDAIAPFLGYIEPDTAPRDDTGPMPGPTKGWAHQRRGYNWAYARLPDARAAYLAMGMGTGKSAIAANLAANSGADRVLVLAPKKVVGGWPHQFAAHALPTGACRPYVPDGKTATAKAAQLDAYLLGAKREGHQAVAVLNYEALIQPSILDHLKRARYEFLIADEGQKLKAHNGKTARAVWHLFRGPHAQKLFLSGTPLADNPLDAFAQFRIMDERVLGTAFGPFRARYAEMHPTFPSKVVTWLHQGELAAKMAPWLFQVGRDVLDLPPAHHVTRAASLSPAGLKAYRELADDLITTLQDGTTATAANAMVKVLRLAQAASGFVVDEAGGAHQIDATKEELLETALDEIGPTEQVVVFARFTHELDRIAAVAARLGRAYGEVSGRRDDLVGSAYPPGVQVLGVNLQAGGAGVDLSAAAYCVYWAVDFSYANYLQSLARCHRPGQTRPVTYVHLLAAGIDRIIREALDLKGDVIDYLMREIAHVERHAH